VRRVVVAESVDRAREVPDSRDRNRPSPDTRALWSLTGADYSIVSQPELIRVHAETQPLDLIDRQSSSFTEPASSDPLVKQSRQFLL
jgi:hypothetical protein